MTPDIRYRAAQGSDIQLDPLEDERRRSLGRIVIAVLCAVVALVIWAVAQR